MLGMPGSKYKHVLCIKGGTIMRIPALNRNPAARQRVEVAHALMNALKSSLRGPRLWQTWLQYLSTIHKQRVFHPRRGGDQGPGPQMCVVAAYQRYLDLSLRWMRTQAGRLHVAQRGTCAADCSFARGGGWSQLISKRIYTGRKVQTCFPIMPMQAIDGDPIVFWMIWYSGIRVDVNPSEWRYLLIRDVEFGILRDAG